MDVDVQLAEIRIGIVFSQAFIGLVELEFGLAKTSGPSGWLMTHSQMPWCHLPPSSPRL